MGVGRGGRANVFMEELLYSSYYIGYFHVYCLNASQERFLLPYCTVWKLRLREVR